MTSDKFSSAVERIVAQDPRFDRDAYFFVRDALEFTAKLHRRGPARGERGTHPTPPVAHHVTGQELLEGVRQFALKEYGPMVTTVFEHWRVSRCEDFGAMVFHLIEAGIFGKNASDTLADFGGGYDFQAAFEEPFMLSGRKAAPARPKA